MIKDYEKNGYLILKNVFSEGELQQLREVVARFHKSWTLENSKFYADKAVNSAYLTAKKHLIDSDRELLFQFIGSAKLMNIVMSIMGANAAFMNTQLFFDPVNEGQKNYWHRDSQYHLSIDEQKEALLGPNVIHFRIPLVDEPGLELLPGTHKRWDNDEELDVRQEENGRVSSEPLSGGKEIPLAAGDILVFSADMLHRGLYGLERLALDILVFDSVAEYVDYVDDDCLPDNSIRFNSTE